MIIDFHTHIFPDKIAKGTLEFLEGKCKTKPYTDGTYKGLLASTKEARIDVSIALPVVTKPSQYPSITRFALQYQEGPILSFAGVHPQDPCAGEQLEELKQLGFKGIKLHPDYQETYFNDLRYKRIVARACELGLIIVVHAGQDPKCPDDVHCTPQMAAELIREVQPEKLVLAHVGGNEQWDEVEEYLVGKDVYFDTGVVLDKMSREQFLRIVRTHGAEKILFATDSPWADQKKYVQILREMPLTEEERAKILGKNAEKLLR